MTNSIFYLENLDGRNGFRLDGVTEGYSLGNSVSSAGDINGDGINDLIIGASRSDPNGRNSGSSYVVFGKRNPFSSSLPLSKLNGRNGFRLDGVTEGDYSGNSVNGAGDINGDGIDDLIIGASRADPNGDSSGSSYVVFGSRNPFSPSLPLSSLNGRNGFRIDGLTQYNSLGFSVSGAGDINGDGIDDLIVGAPGASPNGDSSGSSYVVFGSRNSFSPSLPLSKLNGRNGFRIDGLTQYDSLGYSVSGAGDINGDGIDDLIIGVPFAAPYGMYSGSSYVVFGSRNPFSPSLSLSSLNGRNGFRIDGGREFSLSGVSVSGAGDINGDGIGDLIIGVRGEFIGLSESGSGYSCVVFGSQSFSSVLTLSNLDGNNGFRIFAPNSFGSDFSVSYAGDINNDGFDDFIIGVMAGSEYPSPISANYVVFGGRSFPATLDLNFLSGSDGFCLNNLQLRQTGFSSGGAGDVNGDGIDDLIVGAPISNASYIVFGNRNYAPPALDLNGTSAGLDYNTTFTGSPVALLDRNFSLTDPGSSTGTLSNIRIRLTNRPDGAAESLAVTTTGTRIKATYNADTGLLKLRGFAPLAQYRRVLASLIYTNSAARPTPLDRTITFIADDGAVYTNTSALATTTLSVNQLPRAANDRVTANQNTVLTIPVANLLANDDDPDGDRLSITAVHSSINGTVRLNNNRTPRNSRDDFVTFTPTPGFGGNATFSYTVRDSRNGTATVAVTVVVNKNLQGGNGGDILLGSAGSDRLRGNDGNDFVLGRGGSDTLFGGNGDDFLNGGTGRDYLLGGLGHDRLIGSFGRDQLTGSSGADTFIITDFSESLLSGFDRITDLRIGVDVIDAPNRVDTANLTELGTVSELTESSISALLTSSSFGARGAAVFTFGDRTFLALNDSTAEFSAKSDAIVEITGFRGNLGNLAIATSL